jgi:hypothetical protein
MDTWLLIDGQQRLTTLQLLLQAFQDTVAELGLEPYKQALEKLTRNDHPLSNKAHEQFKIWPTNVDRDDFRRTMESGSPLNLRKEFGVRPAAEIAGRMIPNAYLYFAATVKDWLTADGDPGQRASVLYTALRQHVRLVVIEIDDKDDAQLIFETLNARGTPLLAADLVKNALLQEISAAGGNVEDLYQQYWQPFDAEPGLWRAEVGRGHAARPRIDVYLQHFITLKTKTEVPTAHLYAAYRDYIREHQTEAGTPAERLKALAHYAKIYRRLELRTETRRVNLFLHRLSTMEIGTAYPFLLELFARLNNDRERLETVLQDLESFLVRRMVCRLSTRGYNRLFIDLLETLDGDNEGIPDRVRIALLSGTAEGGFTFLTLVLSAELWACRDGGRE